jgi:hypothetical protein
MAARGDVYSYKANSNLVWTAQRTGKRSRDPSGEVSRMDTKNLGFTMGDRVRKETPPAEGFGSSEGRSKKQNPHDSPLSEAAAPKVD